MNPLFSIWTKTNETIDILKDSSWVNRQGLIFYILFGINSVRESNLFYWFDSKTDVVIIVLFLGSILGLIFRLFWVNVIFYFGKILAGCATKRNVDTILALCLIPEIFRFINFSLHLSLTDDFANMKINYTVTIISILLSFIILVVGLKRVQKFGYGASILNIFLPQLIALFCYYLIQGL